MIFMSIGPRRGATCAQKKKWAKTHRTTPSEDPRRKWIIRKGLGRGKRGMGFGLLTAPNGRASQELSFAFTASLTIFPSAFLPASLAIVAFITPPISFIEAAPVSAIAAATA